MISMIVVNYNAGEMLAECVRAALPQVDEILIADNASTDLSSERCAREFAEEPKLKILRNTANLGFSSACNIGYARAEGDFLLFLNPDCVLAEDAVSALLRVLRSDAAAGMVGALLLNRDGTAQCGARRALPTPWRSFVRAVGLNRLGKRWPAVFADFDMHRQSLPEHPIEVEAISGACMLVKREAIADVGPWDEGYFLHCEDLDWCMRFRQKGWKILFAPEARAVHDQGTCSRARPLFVEWHKHRGMVRFCRKFFRERYPAALWAMVLLGVWLRFALVAGFYSARRALILVGIARG